jgi:hypothetical protein
VLVLPTSPFPTVLLVKVDFPLKNVLLLPDMLEVFDKIDENATRLGALPLCRRLNDSKSWLVRQLAASPDHGRVDQMCRPVKAFDRVWDSVAPRRSGTKLAWCPVSWLP